MLQILYIKTWTIQNIVGEQIKAINVKLILTQMIVYSVLNEVITSPSKRIMPIHCLKFRGTKWSPVNIMLNSTVLALFVFLCYSYHRFQFHTANL
jgi:hypothetical protein